MNIHNSQYYLSQSQNIFLKTFLKQFCGNNYQNLFTFNENFVNTSRIAVDTV